MKRIHIIATNQKRILAVACPTDIPRILHHNESIEGEWYYQSPEGLEKFLNEHADQINYFLKGFSYWILFKVKGYREDPSRYGKLKKAINEFSERLFKKIRALSSRIAREIRKVIKPKALIYHELRKQKRNMQKSASWKTFYINHKKASGFD